MLEVISSIKGVETHLVISKAGEIIINHERGKKIKIEDIKKLASFSYDVDDIGACISSGSFQRDGMIVAP